MKKIIQLFILSFIYGTCVFAQDLFTGTLPQGYLPSNGNASYGKSSSHCPSDTLDLGGFCIDAERHLEITWTAAAKQCTEQNKRLCSHSEWVTACRSFQNGEAKLQNIGEDPEWIDDFSGYKPLMRGFAGDCYFLDTQWPGGPENLARSRCCSSK